MLQKIIDAINTDVLSRTDMYIVHRHVGNLIKRRMFYQLVVTFPGMSNSVSYDHTDRFEEILDQLENVIVDGMNTARMTLSVPPEIFNVRDNVVIGIHSSELFDEYDMRTVFKTYLPSGYDYQIKQFEVEFDFVDPYYR